MLSLFILISAMILQFTFNFFNKKNLEQNVMIKSLMWHILFSFLHKSY
jgi:hypothetical protein